MTSFGMLDSLILASGLVGTCVYISLDGSWIALQRYTDIRGL